jgi:hypothetical protein
MRCLFSGVLFILLCSFACTSQDEDESIDIYLSDEINSRLMQINAAPVPDSVRSSAVKVDRDVRGLILLSKDIENTAACVKLSNSFFDSLAERLNLQSTEYMQISQGMHSREISIHLKQNELTSLNRIASLNKIGNIIPSATR